MAVVRFKKGDFSTAGLPKPLGGRPIGFDFGHWSVLLSDTRMNGRRRLWAQMNLPLPEKRRRKPQQGIAHANRVSKVSNRAKHPADG
jgi:hypothetical protein